MGSIKGTCSAYYAETRPARFWSWVRKTEGCWIWQGSKNNKGYGLFSVACKRTLAHRYAFTLIVGEIPPSKHLDHLCRQPLCVNPRHLEVVSHRENVLRGLSPAANNARKTHCHKGHPFSKKNGLNRSDGKRWCKICERQRDKEKKARRKKREA